MNWAKHLCASLIGLLAACASSGPPPLDLSGMAVEPPAMPNQGELRKLLQKKQFDELHALLERYRVVSLTDVMNGEAPLVLAYEAFYWEASQGRLDQWVRARPRSWHAFTARAFYYESLAFSARGTGWRREVPDSQIKVMEKFHRLAEADARKALALQPNSIAPHRVLLRIVRHYGSRRPGQDATIAEALRAFPASYELRHQVGWSLQPRWISDPGNYAPLEQLVRETQEHVSANPKLRHLLGFPYYARALDLSTAERYEEAVRMFGKALAFGEDPSYLYSRSYAASRGNDHVLAIRDARRYWEVLPKAADVGANVYLLDVLQLARTWVTRMLAEDRSEEALPTLDAYLEAAPDHALMTTVRGIARCRLGMLEAATGDFARALAIDPNFDDAARMRTVCEASGGNPRKAILRLQAHLLITPGDGAAHQQLAGLFSLVGDVQSAITSYWFGCEHGNKDACDRLGHLRKLAKRGIILWPEELFDPPGLHPQQRLASPGEREAFVAKLTSAPQYVSGGAAVKFIDRPLPGFPEWARPIGSGSVSLTIYFDADGAVAGALVNDSKPKGYFELAALASVLRWRIEPRPTGLKATQTIDFRLPTKPQVNPNDEMLIAAAHP